MKPVLLVPIRMPDADLATLRELVDPRYAPDAATRAQAIARDGAGVNIVLANGTAGLTADEIGPMQASLRCFLDNAARFLAGRPVTTPIRATATMQGWTTAANGGNNKELAWT